MRNLYIKVCGITRAKDAKLAISLGADMLGFIFYKNSPRYINQTEAKKIISQLNPLIARVGVFVNEEKEKVLRVAQKLSLDYIQLSGDEPSSDSQFFTRFGFKVIKTIHVAGKKSIMNMKKYQSEILHVDNAGKDTYGGSGNQFDWNMKIPKLKNMMLAGGISSDNVIQGIKKFNPLIIDVNSSIETKPGIKSEKRMIEFFKKVNRYRYGK